MTEIKLHYAIDQRAAMAQGRTIPTDEGQITMNDLLLAALPPDARAFLGAHLRGNVVDLAGAVNHGLTRYPQRDRFMGPDDISAFVAECMAVEDAVTSEREARIAADAAQRAAREAEDEQERAVLASALIAPVASVIGSLPAADLYGSDYSAIYVARTGIREWLAAASTDLAGYWDRHGDRMDLGKAAIGGVAQHIVAMRADRAAIRKQWVDDVVTFFGDDNARERHAAGVLPREDVEKLVWQAIHASDGHSKIDICPSCDDEAHAAWVSDKPVSAAIWDRAQAIAGAISADVLETLGLAITRDIVLMTYDCRECGEEDRFELRVSLEHPENGWKTYTNRYYSLEGV